MHPKMIVKQIIAFNKAAFDNGFDALAVLQYHSEKIMNIFLEKANLFPEEGKIMLADWMGAFKKGEQNFKDSIDDSFDAMEQFFVDCASATGFSVYALMEGMDQSMGEVSDKINKASVDVVDESIQNKTTGADKPAQQNTTTGKIAESDSGNNLTKVVRKSSKPVKKIK
jgi:hypothetical protein